MHRVFHHRDHVGGAVSPTTSGLRLTRVLLGVNACQGRAGGVDEPNAVTYSDHAAFDGLDGGSCSTLPSEFEGGQIESVDGAARARLQAAVIAGRATSTAMATWTFSKLSKPLWRPDVLKLIGLSSSSSELQVLSFFRKADLDGSGSVTRDELTAFLLEKSAGGRHKPPELASPTSVTALEYTSRQSYGFDQTGWVVGGPGGRNLNAFIGSDALNRGDGLPKSTRLN